MLKEPNRLTILIKIIALLTRAEEWKSASFDDGWARNSLEYLYQAKALIELLEELDCGSIGGFDKGANLSARRNLVTRTEWLLNKYKDEKKLPKKTKTDWGILLSIGE